MATITALPGGTMRYDVDSQARTQKMAGILAVLGTDDNLEEIAYNGPTQPLHVYHKQYGFIPTNIAIAEQEARSWAESTARANRKTLTEQTPLLDGTLPDGSRVNITIPPITGTTTITIRRFKRTLITILDMISSKAITTDAAAFIWTAIEGIGYRPANVLIVGGTGTGKTTLLNALTHFIPANQRIVTIEDTAELQLLHANKAAMLARKETNITMDMLLKNALRMRPDRIIVGEVRGAEAATLFEAMNVGHQGCLGTLHADTARESITRITNAPLNVPPTMLNVLDLIIVLKRIVKPSGPTRVISEITEITATTTGDIRYNTLYQYDAKKDSLVNTGIPSRLRGTIADAAGLTPKDFDAIVQDRAKTLTDFAYRKDITPYYLFHALDQLRTHWREELEGRKHESIFSRILRTILGR